ncbi:uncharacterized protein LOC124887696 [Capsicum annuum]|uniref:uncharacterized protein LOC124887696 n=1 Tax=Capsicum annuum TaxID=4072 RepID=UPI001FB0F587|nr:uncharacterized protein LOC124887696 [Capsicum annuum]
MTGFHTCIAKMVVDEDMQDKMTDQISSYQNAKELFGIATAIRQRDKKSPVEWWRLYGSETPELQKFAIEILGLTCIASGCERNWSVFEHIHTKKRNRLTLEHLSNLVFIKYNRTLRCRYNVRNGFDPINLDNIDDANEWLTGIENIEDESVFDGDTTFIWSVVAEASGVDERRYDLRASTSSSYDKGTGDEEDEEVENDENYVDTQGIEELDNLNELEEL